MKKTVILGTLSCLAGASFAQPANVTIYGLLDIGVESVSNVGAAGNTLNRMPTSTNSMPSRLGFRGREDLGNGLSAFFTLEQGIIGKTGTLSQGGRTFGRQAFVGLSGPFGSVALGRQYTMTFWSGTSADIHGGGIYGTGSLDSYLPNARADNALSWRRKFGNLDLGATYSFGRDAVNAGPSPAGTNCPGESVDSKACREWSVMAKYDTPQWGAAIANDRIYGRTLSGPGDAIFGGLNSSDKSDNRLILNGWFKVGEAKIGGGLIRRANDGSTTRPDSNLFHVGASMPLSSALTLSGQVVTLRFKATSDATATVSAARLTYALSKRTAVYGQIGHISNGVLSSVAVSGGSPGSNPAVGASQTGINVGLRTTF
jgi:predicted porin